MNNDRYVAAIEVSSSKIMAAVGRMHPDGMLDIIAAEQERGIESVRYGIISNPEETMMRVNRVIERLQQKPGVSPRVIDGLFVGLSGRSLRSISTRVEINLPDETEITDDILARLREQALVTAIDSSLEVVDAIPRVYTVGKYETTSPKGAVGNRISAVYDLIVCRPDMRRNLTRTIPEKLDIEICGFVVTALATAQVILTSEEKRLGCMLVDMGAETTAVSIYKDGYLRYFATLPLGGRNITRDITSLNVLEERAEEIKLNSGNALAHDNVSSLNVNGIRMSDVSNLVVARSEEIVANIVEQFKYAGIKDTDLPAGLVCIGGGVKLNGMTELIARQTDLPVRRGQLPGYIRIENGRNAPADLLQVASLLYCGASASPRAECLAMPGAQELPATGEGNELPREAAEPEAHRSAKKRGGLFNGISDKLARLFAAPSEDDSDLME